MKSLVINHASGLSQSNDYSLSKIQKEIDSILLESHEWYPEIAFWYFHKFVPGLNDGSRNILTYIVDNKVAGIALLKNESTEKKICTFRVNSLYRNNGIGKTLFAKCLEILDMDKPVFTIPSERLCYFSTIIKLFDFKLEQVAQNYYRNNSIEYVFNGYLDLQKTLTYGELEIQEHNCCEHVSPASL